MPYSSAIGFFVIGFSPIEATVVPPPPPTPVISQYTNLITSEYSNATKFLRTISITVQGAIDTQAVLSGMSQGFDLDVAVGQQEDYTGQWIGVSRKLPVPLSDVYFSFDIAGLGFDQGTWYGPFDPTTFIDTLPDDAYRVLLRAKVGANQWDGTIPDAYRIYAYILQGTGTDVLIQDNGDSTMSVTLVGAPPTAVLAALFTGEYLALRPAGVTCTYII